MRYSLVCCVFLIFCSSNPAFRIKFMDEYKMRPNHLCKSIILVIMEKNKRGYFGMNYMPIKIS